MSGFSNRVLNWYDAHARSLPWRGLNDPYAIWVSEIMLQQTRVETVIPYFERWMRQFPTIQSLAQAPLQTVLSAWEGLGYYNRARNLHKAAAIIINEFAGELPQEIQLLQKLPGIGRYTASAIASMAFNQDVATLDGNLRRVFARVFDVSSAADQPEGETILWKLAQDNLMPGRAGDYNQALMDLGSAICLPKKPLCLLCPLGDICRSRSNPESRPILKPKPVVPHRIKMAAVVFQDDCVLLSLRPAKGLLGGLWEFPSVPVNNDSVDAMVDALGRDYFLAVKPLRFMAEIRHAYTHFTLTEFVWHCEMMEKSENQSLQWVPIPELADYPMGKVDRAISSKIGA